MVKYLKTFASMLGIIPAAISCRGFRFGGAGVDCVVYSELERGSVDYRFHDCHGCCVSDMLGKSRRSADTTAFTP